MESDEPVFEGFIFLPPIGKILKKTWQKKYCLLYKRSSSGRARIEIFENETKTGQAKMITFEDVIKITPQSSNRINIVTKNAQVEFGTMTDEDMNSWFRALKSVAFPDEISSIEQDNDLYCSTNEGVFCVKLHHSEASQRCNLASKNYILVITATALQLLSEEDNHKLLYTWPFSYIRKYGYKEGKFTFEAGRKCSSGEGVFYLEHANHNEIYRCLSTRMKNMKKLLSGESTSSLIDCGDLQLQAAFNMEAGSRNPLPQSISRQASFPESTNSSLLPHIFSTSSIENLSKIKAVPKKPPRKSVPLHVAQTPIVTVNTSHEYADVNQFEPGKYDTIESRTEAWKTLGVENPPHSELVSSEQQETYFSWGTSRLNSEIKGTEKTSAPAVIIERTTSAISDYYDCPQHFGSSSALNVASGYKNIQITKTVENLSHTEESLPNYSEEYASWATAPQLSKVLSEIKLTTEETHAPTVISEPNQSDELGYDHLNYFGQSSALNAASADYTQVNTTSSSPVPPAKPSTSSSSANLYEEVNVMESVRSADDSHLGYALIKKDSVSGALKEIHQSFEEAKEATTAQRVAHHYQNCQAYAVISKPKRV